MAFEYKSKIRVQFSETDMGGIVHFANYYRYMEVCEYDYFHSLGTSVYQEVDNDPLKGFGWPRVETQCKYIAPLHFKDLVEVHLIVRKKGRSSLRYEFIIKRLEPEPVQVVARASISIVCVQHNPANGGMRSVVIPEPLASQIEQAPDDYMVAE